jgi:hypothetical protein
LVFQNLVFHNYLKNRKDFFHIDDVLISIDELSYHFVDAALLVYIEKGEFKFKLLTQSTKNTNNNLSSPNSPISTTSHSLSETNLKYDVLSSSSFVYAVVEDDTKTVIDLTQEFNLFEIGKVQSNLDCKDIVKIMVKYKRQSINFDDFTLKLMKDNDFNELLLKGIDLISS